MLNKRFEKFNYMYASIYISLNVRYVSLNLHQLVINTKYSQVNIYRKFVRNLFNLAMLYNNVATFNET